MSVNSITSNLSWAETKMLLDWEKWLCFKKGLFSNTISTRTLLQPRLTVLYTPSRKDRNLVSCTLPNTIESHENYWFVIKICIFQILNLNKILLVYFKMSRSFFYKALLYKKNLPPRHHPSYLWEQAKAMCVDAP